MDRARRLAKIAFNSKNVSVPTIGALRQRVSAFEAVANCLKGQAFFVFYNGWD
jgi:hypothetical protein